MVESREEEKVRDNEREKEKKERKKLSELTGTRVSGKEFVWPVQ